MICPDTDKWLLLLLGELSVNEAGELQQHGARCASCRAHLHECRALLEDLSSAPRLELTDDAFVERALAACASAPGAEPPRGGLKKRALWGGVLAAAAALLLAWPRADGERWTARGKPASPVQELPGAELFFVRDGAVQPLASATLGSGDRILVRYRNPGSTPAFLMVFAVDAAGEVHWIYPAYLDPSHDPASVEIEPNVKERALDEVVEPAAPAPGHFRAFAVFSRRPLRVRAVEALLRQGDDADLAARLPDAAVREWSATWRD